MLSFQQEKPSQNEKELSEETITQTHTEISLMKTICHPNIVRMIDYFENREYI